MTGFEQILDNIIRSAEENAVVDDAYYIGEDGLRYCHKCNSRKQYKLFVPFRDSYSIVPVMCECDKERLEQEKVERKKRENEKRIEELRRVGIADPKYLEWTFDKDDRKNPKLSETARRYCENWDEMKAKNIGLMFYGDVDGGKSFMAAAIANALIEKGVYVVMSSMSDFLRGITPFEDNVTDKVMAADLLIIDELGRTRETPMAVENMQSIIDARTRSGKPLIVTTNLSLDYMSKAEDDNLRAFFSRLRGMCVPVFVQQQGRREQEGQSKRDALAKLFGS